METSILTSLSQQGIISSLDFHFAGFIAGLSDQSEPEFTLAAALASKFTQEGHICLDLTSLAGKTLSQDDEYGSYPELLRWREVLEKRPCSPLNIL